MASKCAYSAGFFSAARRSLQNLRMQGQAPRADFREGGLGTIGAIPVANLAGYYATAGAKDPLVARADLFTNTALNFHLLPRFPHAPMGQ